MGASDLGSAVEHLVTKHKTCQLQRATRMPTGRSIAEENLSNTDASLWLNGKTPPFGWWNRWMIAFSTISVCATLTVLLTFYLHWDHIAKGKMRGLKS